MFEPELKYCPRCREEYRPEIVSCAVCGLALLSGREMAARAGGRARPVAEPLSPKDELVALQQGGLPELRRLADLLAGQGLASLVVADESSCGQGCCASTCVLQVRRQEAEEAMALIREDYVRHTGLAEHDTTHAGSVFDPQASQVTCPACGHRFTPTSASCPDCGLCFG